MREERAEAITVTLHWLVDGRRQASTIICEDSPPVSLIPLLLEGCGLRPADERDRPRPYTLRLGAADGRPLRPDTPVGRQGLRSGGHLWLTDGGPPARRRCLLTLPDGSEAVLPPRRIELSRGWLLQLTALQNPAAHLTELERLERRESPYAYVSKRAHCALEPGRGASWSITTGRVDVATLRNGARLFPEAPEPLDDGDRITLGAYGPTLVVSFVA